MQQHAWSQNNCILRPAIDASAVDASTIDASAINASAIDAAAIDASSPASPDDWMRITLKRSLPDSLIMRGEGPVWAKWALPCVAFCPLALSVLGSRTSGRFELHEGHAAARRWMKCKPLHRACAKFLHNYSKFVIWMSFVIYFCFFGGEIRSERSDPYERILIILERKTETELTINYWIRSD